MGTKTVDEAVDANGTEAKSDKETVNVTKTEEAPAAEVVDEQHAIEDEAEAEDLDAEDLEGDGAPEAEKDASGVGLGAAAVVSAGLGIVSLTGSWVATVASAREALVGQLETSSNANATVATQVKEIYGDAWATTALVGGLFALLALLVGVFVLVRPAFGAPGKPQAAWIKSVAWAGVSLGVIGLVLAVAKYSDILLGLPSTS